MKEQTSSSVDDISVMIVYIGDVDVSTVLHHGRIVVCCICGRAPILALTISFCLSRVASLLRRLLCQIIFWRGNFVRLFFYLRVLRSQFLTLGMRKQQGILL